MTNQFEKSRPPTSLPTMGMMTSLTNESTILPNAAPMITPTARSTTLPFIANSRNSVMNDIRIPPHKVSAALRPSILSLHGTFARFPRANAHGLLHVRYEDFSIADLARARRLDDRLDRALDQR